MEITQGFPSFNKLPPEIRLRVWGYALSVWSVYSALPLQTSSDNQSFSAELPSVGPTSSPAAVACREAWFELRALSNRSYATRKHKQLPWFCTLPTTIIYLGHANEAYKALNTLGIYDLSTIKHIVLSWDNFLTLAKVCITIAEKCPQLHTLVVCSIAANPFNAGEPLATLSTTDATRYAAIVSSSGPERDHPGIDSSYFRSLILGYFPNSRPAVHMLPP